jgi:hypothetical protein
MRRILYFTKIVESFRLNNLDHRINQLDLIIRKYCFSGIDISMDEFDN